MKVAVVGVTGLVGTRMMEVLAERNFPVTEFLPVASERSVGRKVTFKGKEYTVISAEDAIAAKPDLAIFSAHGSTARATPRCFPPRAAWSCWKKQRRRRSASSICPAFGTTPSSRRRLPAIRQNSTALQ